MAHSIQTFYEVATSENDVVEGDGWKASKLHFEFPEEVDTELNHRGYVLFCLPGNRPSSRPLWHTDRNEVLQRCPPYFLLPPGRSLAMHFEVGRCAALVFQFNSDLLEFLAQDFKTDAVVGGLNESTHQLICLSLKELTNTLDDTIDIRQDLVRCLLVSAGRLLLRPAQQGVAIDPSEEVDAVARQIGSNIRSQRPPLEGLCEIAGMSERHLQRTFKNEMGLSLQDYVAEFRLDVAKELLEADELTLKAIAYSLGYANPSHFTRSFKAATGMAPSVYRRSASKLSSH